MGDATCSIPDCPNSATRRFGYCHTHYQRWRLHGDPSVSSAPRPPRDPMPRFMAKVDASGVCWEWTGNRIRGYGYFQVDGKSALAHRWLYERLVSPLALSLDLDHLCRNRCCVNPDHLEPVTHRVNVLRGAGVAAQHARKTHCVRNHPLSGPNLRIRVRPGGYVERVCRACFNDRSRERALR